jgi:hypothetical protein
MPRHLRPGWAAAIGLLLVLGGLLLMHLVDGGEQEQAGTATYGMDEAPRHDCAGCHHGVHLPAACTASLGAVAAWRVSKRRRGIRPSLETSRRRQGRQGRPPALLRSEQPPWIALCVMRN